MCICNQKKNIASVSGNHGNCDFQVQVEKRKEELVKLSYSGNQL
jgi:hypothetical protein